MRSDDLRSPTASHDQGDNGLPLHTEESTPGTKATHKHHDKPWTGSFITGF